jgi:alpha/beta superfamily hydrolase
MEPNKQSLSFGQKWSAARPTKTVVFWSCVASAVVTMIIGFSWGGWVTGSTARSMATVNGEDAVVKRLAPICVVRFTQDPSKDLKLKEVKATDTWQRGDYVKKQGWATMPGEQEPDGKVADECVKLLMLTSSK